MPFVANLPHESREEPERPHKGRLTSGHDVLAGSDTHHSLIYGHRGDSAESLVAPTFSHPSWGTSHM